jgi:protocatechuate 3,4-dioxygenase beta subunit
MYHVLARTMILMAVTLSAVICAMAQSIASQSKEVTASGSIAGRVTLAGKPAAGFAVMLMKEYADPRFERAFARTTTDQDGHFQLARLPAGRYSVLVPAAVYCSESEPRYPSDQGKAIMLAEGENVEGIEITLRRGGVITGRISDTQGRPLVQQMVTLSRLDTNGRKQPFYPMSLRMMQTDDRGVYRIYGLPAGRYLVAVGHDAKGGRAGGGNVYYLRTYHPGETDEAKATVVEVTEGSEASGVDVLVGRKQKAFTVSGRIIDADTGKPIANATYGYSNLQDNGPSVISASMGMRADSRGEFRMEGITSGRYLMVLSSDNSELVSEDTPFEVSDADVTGIEVKARRGASINGTVTIEGVNEQEMPALLSTIQIKCYLSARPYQPNHTRANPDGSFRLTGVPAGRVQFFAGNDKEPSDLSLLRVERDGVDQTPGIEVAAGENISGLRISLAYGSGVIHGQVQLGDGPLPAGAQIRVQAHRSGDSPARNDYGAEVDSRGHFLIESLLPGQYEVVVNGRMGNAPGQPARRLKEARQSVSVTNGSEANIKVIVELEDKNN